MEVVGHLRYRSQAIFNCFRSDCRMKQAMEKLVQSESRKNSLTNKFISDTLGVSSPKQHNLNRKRGIGPFFAANGNTASTESSQSSY